MLTSTKYTANSFSRQHFQMCFADPSMGNSADADQMSPDVMRGSRDFRQGGGGVQVNLAKKALTTFFFFLVLRLFYRSQNG